MNNTYSNITGLFFGSFNPIHIGHMALANYMIEYSSMKELWFIVSPQSPFKTNTSMLDNYDRLELVHRAIGDDERFKVSDIEFHMPVPSYTIDSLTYLSEKYPKKHFALIIGADNLFHFHKWKNYKLLQEKYSIFVYPRRGFPKEQCPQFPNLHWIEAPIIEISSSFIRKSIAHKKDMRYFLPHKVWEYIDEMNFYR